MMKVAIPQWQGRVSPVFDVAGNVLLVDVAKGAEQTRQNVALEASQPQFRASMLAVHGTSVLICGAISRPMEMAVFAAGIEVISNICGDIEQVLTAFIGGNLDKDTFSMPGCCGRRRQFNAGRRRGGRCWQHGKKGGN